MKLNDTEQNYPTHEQELLAFVFALKKFRHYLLNQPFELHTDNWVLTFIQTHPTLLSRQARWLDVIQEFEFKVLHIKGN